MQKEEDKLLVRIAEMYYQEDKNQSQISKELNIHRSTISRLLKRSRTSLRTSDRVHPKRSGTIATILPASYLTTLLLFSPLSLILFLLSYTFFMLLL